MRDAGQKQIWVPSRDPLEMPNYSASEAAFYLQISSSTLRSWILPARDGAPPVIEVPIPGQTQLSHINLIEAYVLDAIRKDHGISLQKIRSALDYVRDRCRVSHPLARQLFQTDGLDLFVERAEGLINVTSKGRRGQMAMREIIGPYLERIEYDSAGLPVRLYLLTRREKRSSDPRTLEIRPLISAGRPVLTGTRIAIETLEGRFKAGESMRSIAEDMDLEQDKVEEAIRCWLILQDHAA